MLLVKKYEFNYRYKYLWVSVLQSNNEELNS